MSDIDLRRHFERQGVAIDFEDTRDMVSIGLHLGLVSLVPLGLESPSIHSDQDVIRLRRDQGRVVLPIAYGQAIFQAVPIERSAL